MTEAQGIELAAQVVADAIRLGAEQAEVSISIGRRFHVEARDRTISKLEGSTGKGLHARLYVGGGRKAALSTSDFSTGHLRESLSRVIAQASYVAPDPFAALPEQFAETGVDLGLYDEALASRDDAAKVDDALAMERVIRESDARVTNSSGSHYGDSISTTILANSGGFASAYTATRASRSSGPVAEDGDIKRTAHYGTASRTLAGMEDVDYVGRMAARRAVDLFGARKPPTMRVPVIFDRDVASSVLDDLFAAIAASNVAIGNSWLASKVGEKIGSDLVTIVDDGRLPGELGSSPFDGEGVATRRTPVFERGVLKTFLYDTYYGRKLGAASTGNSTGSGIGPNNFYLAAGDRSVQELIAATPRGILVLDTIGFATEHASGTYSRGARGFFIENGEIAYPVDEFTIAGRFIDMLAGIDAVADDLRHDGAVVSPSFRIAEMTISGN
jgi:PmbA protein